MSKERVGNGRCSFVVFVQHVLPLDQKMADEGKQVSGLMRLLLSSQGD